MADVNLTTGCLLGIMRGTVIENPVVQIIGSKRIESNSDKVRHRILLSDGKYKISYAMYTVQGNDELFANGEIPENTVVILKKYCISSVGAQSKDKSILVVLDVEIVKSGQQIGKIIGSPEALSHSLTQQLDDKENSTQNSGSSTSSSGLVRSRQPTTDYEPPAKRSNSTATPTVSAYIHSSTADSTLNTELVFPISSISPYQNKWVIKARVMAKTPIRTWSNAKGEGKLFSFDLVDQSGEIRVTAFRDMVDKYFDFVEVDKVYYISKCQVKIANKRFSALKNEYEMTLGSESVVQECNGGDTDVPKMQYNFIKIDKINEMEPQSMLDVIGVCKQMGDIQTIVARTTSRELKKREVVLVDQSKCSVTLTLWGDEAERFDALSQVVAVKGARINEFLGGKSLSVPQGASAQINPVVQEAFALRGWYDNGGAQEESVNVSARSGSSGGSVNWMNFKQVTADNNMGVSERGDYYQNVATVLVVRHENLVYEACSSANCNKKVLNMENGRYRCEKCNAETPEMKYRLIGNVNLGDWSGNQWASLFNDDCEFVFGKTAKQIGEGLRDDPNFIRDIANELNFQKFQFRFRVKLETYNDDSRLRTVAVKVEPVNYKSYNAHLISRIEQMIE